MEPSRPDSRRRAILESSRPSSEHSHLLPRWNFLTSSVTATPSISLGSTTTLRADALVEDRVTSASRLPSYCDAPSVPAPPLLAVPLVRSPFNPQSLSASKTYNALLPRRLHRQHAPLDLHHRSAPMSLDDPDVELLKEPVARRYQSLPQPSILPCEDIAVCDERAVNLSYFPTSQDAIPRLLEEYAHRSTPQLKPAVTDVALRGLLEVNPVLSCSNMSMESRFAPTPNAGSGREGALSRDGEGVAQRRVHFHDESGQLEKRSVVASTRDGQRPPPKMTTPRATSKGTPSSSNSHRSESNTPDETRRRTSRAMFMERLAMVKTALGKVVADVADEFDFKSDETQMQALQDVVALLDDAMLGQEYSIAHPALPQSAEFFSNEGAGFAKVFGGTSWKQRKGHNRIQCASPDALDSRSPPRSPVPLPRSSGASFPLAVAPLPLLTTRRDSAYCRRVAESRKKTGIGAASDQLFAAAEDMEQANALNLQSLMPQHEEAMNQLKVLGLL